MQDKRGDIYKKKEFRMRCANRTPVFKKRRLPTLPRVCSTIGAGGLNCSVRNGKRWNPATIATLIAIMTANNDDKNKHEVNGQETAWHAKRNPSGN